MIPFCMVQVWKVAHLIYTFTQVLYSSIKERTILWCPGEDKRINYATAIDYNKYFREVGAYDLIFNAIKIVVPENIAKIDETVVSSGKYDLSHQWISGGAYPDTQQGFYLQCHGGVLIH